MTVVGPLGVDVSIELTLHWVMLGERLAQESDKDQANLLCAFAEMLQRYDVDGGKQTAAIAGVVLAWEKDDPEARVSREALQKFCRDLLAHLDEGAR